MDFILNCFRKPTKLDAATLECQDASTSGAIIDALRGDACLLYTSPSPRD